MQIFHKLFFDAETIRQFPDQDFLRNMNFNEAGQHQIMTFERINNSITDALLLYAQNQNPNTTIDKAFCLQLAWSGTYGSAAWNNLSEDEKAAKIKIIEGERGNNSYKLKDLLQDYDKQGQPCN